MQTNWQEAKVNDVASFLNGYPFKSKELSSDMSGIPVIKMGNLVIGGGLDLSTFKSFYSGSITKNIEKAFAQ